MKDLTESKVYKCSEGGTRKLIFEGTEKECIEFCESLDWVSIDENGFRWELEIE